MVRVHPTATMISKIDTVDDREFTEIITSSRMWKEIGRKFGYQKNLSSNLRKKVRQRCEQLGLDYLEPKKTLAVSKRTKGELFANRRNWQSARSAIRRDAQEVFNKSNKSKQCIICGYDKHIEIAHVKAVSEFNDEALVSEINHIDNLIALCPNHHWEYDKGILELGNVL